MDELIDVQNPSLTTPIVDDQPPELHVALIGHTSKKLCQT